MNQYRVINKHRPIDSIYIWAEKVTLCGEEYPSMHFWIGNRIIASVYIEEYQVSQVEGMEDAAVCISKQR